jgi:DNA invertase Pin-like site-specific DNA recombinase
MENVKRPIGGQIKITEDMVRKVRDLLSVHSQRTVASMSSLSQSTIWRIANGQYEVKKERKQQEEMFDWEDYKLGVI